MELDQYKVELEPKSKILIVSNPSETTTLDKLFEIKELLEKSTNSKYNYGIIYRLPGFWFSYNLSNRSVIVCGKMNKKECIDETKLFIKN